MTGNMEELGINVEEESKNTGNFEALPEAEYQVVVTESELKKNKDNDGQHISVTMQVIEGAFEGRVVWANFNVKNSNPTAEKIGRGELASLCKAIGLVNPKETEELKDKPLLVKLGIDKKDNSKNRIKSYMALEQPGAAPVTKPAAQAPAPVKTASKPWRK